MSEVPLQVVRRVSARGLKKSGALCTMGSTVWRGERGRREIARGRRGCTRPPRYTPPYSGLYRGG